MKIRANLKVMPPLAALMLLATVGCGRDTVRVYNVDTNEAVAATPPPASAPATMGSGMPATMPTGLPMPDTSSLPALKYTVPPGWQEKPPTEIRLASFSIAENGKQADVSVVPLGGMGGGDLANVNRWRGQVGLQQITDEALAKLPDWPPICMTWRAMIPAKRMCSAYWAPFCIATTQFGFSKLPVKPPWWKSRSPRSFNF